MLDLQTCVPLLPISLRIKKGGDNAYLREMLSSFHINKIPENTDAVIDRPLVPIWEASCRASLCFL